MGIRWTVSAVDQMRRMFATGASDAEIAAAIGKTVRGVRCARYDAGLLRSHLRDPPRNHAMPWTPRDDALLIQMSRQLYDLPDIAERLGRTPLAIKRRRRGRLPPVSTRRQWVAVDDARLLSLFRGGLSALRIGNTIGRTKNSVIGRMHRLGLASSNGRESQ